MTGELSATQTLAECEQVIERGLKTFVEVGVALTEIRDRRLYRGDHATFEDYCRDRWGLSSRHANRTIEAAKVAGILGPIGPVPANEAQARELAPLLDDPDRLRDTWQRAVDSAAGRPTAADVAAARGAEPTEPDGEDGDAFERKIAEARTNFADWCLAADDGLCRRYAEHVLIGEAARDLLRSGSCPLPPPSWTCTGKPDPDPGGHTPRTRRLNGLRREANRLAIWEILVMREAGAFLNWCDEAGITIGKRVTFAERLRYPVEDGVRQLLAEDGWTADDEHSAALGHFYIWWCTSGELAGMRGAA